MQEPARATGEVTPSDAHAGDQLLERRRSWYRGE